MVIIAVILSLLAACAKPGAQKPAAEPAAPKIAEVKVGMLLPLSGGSAPVGEQTRTAADFAAARINAAGGIKSLGGAQLKLIYADSKGDQQVGVSETERLITQEKVAVVMGAYQSAVTMTSTQAAERLKVPYINPIAVADGITERGFQYVFRITAKASAKAKVHMDFLPYIAKQTGKEIKTVAFIYENTDWGQSTAKAWKESAPKLGYKVVLDEAYTNNLQDATPIATKVKGANPDVVLLVSYTGDAIQLVNAMAKLQVDAMAIMGAAGGYADPKFLPGVGKNGDLLYDITAWSPDIEKPAARQINQEFKAKHNYDLNGEMVDQILGMYVLADALERAKSIEPQKVRDALAATDLKGGIVDISIYQGVKFDQAGQNMFASELLVQFQNGERKTLFPAEVAPKANKPVFPVPKWADRK
jgi:branched-chain amino acid transport system substrate-binding protein